MIQLGVVLILGAGAFAVSWLAGAPPPFLAGRSWRVHLPIALLLGLAACAGVLTQSGSLYYRLDRGGTSVEGVVTAKEPDNHGLVRYRYPAFGREQTGSGNAGYGNPPFERLAVGDRLRVVYLTERPEVSVPGDPRDRLLNQLQGAGFFGVILSAVAYAGLRRPRSHPPARINGWRVVGITMLVLGVTEVVGCFTVRWELSHGHPIGPLLCGFFVLAFFGFGAFAMRMSRRVERPRP